MPKTARLRRTATRLRVAGIVAAAMVGVATTSATTDAHPTVRIAIATPACGNCWGSN